MKTFLTLVFMIFSAHSFAYTVYQPNGSSYSSYGSGKTKTYRGYNTNTGSSWSQTNNGSYYHGTDSKGGNYFGNRKSGYYHNTRSGKTCYGKGYNRVCN